MPNTSKPYKILFFRVDPGSKEKLALQGEDLSKIYEAIANSNLFEVVDLGKATLSETIAQLVSLDPDIIHFSGHGTKVALSVENYSNTDKEQAKNSTFLTPNDLNQLLGYILNSNKPRLLFINACLAGKVAQSISKKMLSDSNCIVGMTNVLNQNLALNFTSIFYDSLVQGNPVHRILDAFEGAITAAQISLQENDEAGFDPQPRAFGNTQLRFKTIIPIAVEAIKTRELNTNSPYKGLKSFEQKDKEHFFGRDQFIEDVLVQGIEHTDFLLLLGASGSGKSSVIRAGFIPELQQQRGSRFVSFVFKPDSDPFDAFYGSLLGQGFSQTEAKLARIGDANTLGQVVKTLKPPEAFWLIVIDQFEELFTVSEVDKRESFIKGLVKLVQAAPPAVKVVATMRADFLDRLSPYPQLVKLTERPFIAEMQEDELRLAIEQPAASHGVVFETGLVEEIIKAVRGQAGYLPLLQYTLNQLWESEVEDGGIQDRTLNIESYRRLGGVRGALQQRVSQIYESLTELEKLATQRIFLKLVGIGGSGTTDTDWKPVRKREARSRFTEPLEQQVLTQLINANLLVSDTPAEQPEAEATVEIAHEILLTSWDELRGWIEDDREAIALRNRLQEDVDRWKEKQPEDELWSGSKLEKVLELNRDNTFNQVLGGFEPKDIEFIQASEAQKDRQRRRALRTAWSFVGVVSAALITSIGLGLQARHERKQAELNQAQSLGRFSLALFEEDETFEAMTMAVRAGKLLQRHAGEDQVVKEALYNIYYTQQQNQLDHIEAVNSVTFSPDGEIIARHCPVKG